MNKVKIRIQNRDILKKRVKISARCLNYKIFKGLKRVFQLHKPKNILIYIPLSYEVNLLKIERYFKLKCQVFTVSMENLNLKVVKLRRPFKKVTFGIKEPINSNKSIQKIDLAIVPVVGVDGHFARIGHGAGFYDRFFDSLNYKIKTVVFVSIIDLFTKDFLTDSHDIKAKYYLTPNKNYILRGSYIGNVSRIDSDVNGRFIRICNY